MPRTWRHGFRERSSDRSRRFVEDRSTFGSLPLQATLAGATGTVIRSSPFLYSARARAGFTG